jgi:glycosyltransferase involved in cell wall biosynthesis
MPDVKHTVAIPSYRRPEELRRALEALTKQYRQADEVIVVARKDDTATRDVAHEFVSVLPLKLELVERPGMVEAVNRAFDAATGDIIALTDDDAAPHADWVEKIAKAFEDDRDLAGLGGKDLIFVSGGTLSDGAAPIVGMVRWYGRIFGYHHQGVGTKRDVDCLKGVNMSFRRAALGKLRMDERLRGTGAQCHCDLKLCLALRAQGKRLAYDPSILVDHFPAPRFDEDQRGSFNALAYKNDIHNVTLALLEYLGPTGRVILIPQALLIGRWNGYCGILKGLLLWPRIGIRRACERTAASAGGVCAAWMTWLAGTKTASARANYEQNAGKGVPAERP